MNSKMSSIDSAIKPFNSKLRGIEYEAMVIARRHDLDDHKQEYFTWFANTILKR